MSIEKSVLAKLLKLPADKQQGVGGEGQVYYHSKFRMTNTRKCKADDQLFLC